MENNDYIQELKQRVKELENFKHSIEKKMYAGTAVFALLTALGFFGATWTNSLKNNLESLSKRTVPLENKLSDWERLVDTSIGQLDQQQDALFKEAKSNIEQAGQAKISEIQNVKIEELLAELKNGTQELSLRAVDIKNSEGVVVATIGSDKGGNGAMRINNESGDRKVLLYLDNDQPQIWFYNHKNKSALIFGVYSDQDRGFIRFFGEDGEKTLVEIDSNDKGGTITQYHTSGNQIIYVGPERNTGNGIFNASDSSGNNTVSHTP